MHTRFTPRTWFPALLAFLVLVVPPALADGLTVTPDRTRLRANETLSLRVEAEGAFSGTPDFQLLHKDFEVLGQSSGTSMSIVNGSVTSTRQWTLELAPRRTGRLEVPPLSLGGQKSRPLAIEVLAADQPDPAAGARPVFVDTLVDTDKPFVQQPFSYRVRVLYREQPRRAVLDEPTATGAVLERQGEDQNYTEQVNGQTYQVVERRYLVTPQRSGTLTIEGPRLEVLMPEARPGARRSPFADFGDPFGGSGFADLMDPTAVRRVIERGPARTVEVRPQPDTGGAAWLPAESVQLTDEWTPSPPRFKVGEPVTRTLVITARGATATQLPTLDPGTPDGARIYPEQPKTEDLPGAVPSALKTLKVAVVPTRAGPLTLPEIRLHWWDTTTNEARVAAIPERTVQVAAGDGPASAPAPTTMPVGTAAPAAVPEPLPTTPDAAAARPPAIGDSPRAAIESQSPWRWLAGFFALAWVLTLLWALRRRSAAAARPAAVRARLPAPPTGMPAARARARSACAAGDARGARGALLDWARGRWPEQPPTGLGDLGARLDPAAAGALAGLDRAIYAPGDTPWDGPAVWEQIEPALLAGEREPALGGTAALPGLYPDAG